MADEKHPPHLVKALRERSEKGSLRKLTRDFPPVDFCSNDYLGFSAQGYVSDYVAKRSALSSRSGSGGSRLISGNTVFTEETEAYVAAFHHAEAALLYNSGYDANVGLLSCVPQKGDLVLYDELIHASLYDGIRLSHATSYKFKHNSITDLAALLNRHQSGFRSVYVVVESIYSMDGDEAPLKAIITLLNEQGNGFLIVDEAHAIGVFGKEGRGLCEQLAIEQLCFARIYTYGKAMGVHGAAIAGSRLLKDYLINFSRSFIYTTALPLHSVENIMAAYQLLPVQGETKRQQLLNNIAYFKQATIDIPGFIPSNSSIQCLVLGSNGAVDDMEQKLARNGIYAKAIKSPTVKEGSERIRFCLHAFNTQPELELLMKCIHG